MSKKEIHFRKYKAFRKVAYAEGIEDYVRIANLFDALFQLIEACVATRSIHIQHHAEVPRTLRAQPDILGDKTDEVVSIFSKIEREFRVGCEYGGSDGRQEWKTAQPLFEKVERIASHALGEIG